MKCKICGDKTQIWFSSLFDDRHGYPGHFDVRKCIACGFAQTSPQISPSKISALYEKYYPRQNIKAKDVLIENYQDNERSKLEQSGLLTNCEYHIKGLHKTVLDVGCGVGYSLLWLKNMGHRPYGIDPDKTGKSVARKYGIPFHYGFIEDHPFGKMYFDYVIASQTLEHTNDPVTFVKECAKRLEPNGVLILSFPNVNSLTRILLGKRWLHWHIPYHLNHFSKQSVNLLAEKADLRVNQIDTETPNMWTSIQLRNLLAGQVYRKRDSFWDGGSSGSQTSLLTNYMSRVISLFERYNYFNRIVDDFGYGESFVVTFSAKQ